MRQAMLSLYVCICVVLYTSVLTNDTDAFVPFHYSSFSSPEVYVYLLIVIWNFSSDDTLVCLYTHWTFIIFEVKAREKSEVYTKWRIFCKYHLKICVGIFLTQIQPENEVGTVDYIHVTWFNSDCMLNIRKKIGLKTMKNFKKLSFGKI